MKFKPFIIYKSKGAFENILWDIKIEILLKCANVSFISEPPIASRIDSRQSKLFMIIIHQ